MKKTEKISFRFLKNRKEKTLLRAGLMFTAPLFTGSLITGSLIASMAPAAFADGNSAVITQVSPTPTPAAPGRESESSIHPMGPSAVNQGDYQTEVLSNPMISDIGRADSLTGGGGNTAVVVQEGTANRSTVKQSGQDNSATQIQQGKANDIYLDQQGNHNRSTEKQKGNYNHKVKIQNGVREESIIENPENDSGGTPPTP